MVLTVYDNLPKTTFQSIQFDFKDYQVHYVV